MGSKMVPGTILAGMLLLMSVKSAWCIKVTAQAVPAVVKRGGDVALKCLYDLQGAHLYTFKFYRGYREFYRYNPSQPPYKSIFPINGLNVDLTLSNESQVMLREVDFPVAGSYSCEISADAPSFTTSIANINLDVVLPPKKGPELKTELNKYDIGDVLNSTCTSSPSKPPVNLTLLINNQVIPMTTRRILKSPDGLEYSSESMSIQLKQSHFKNGLLRLQCIAQLHPVYLESTNLNFASLQEPMWQRRMSPSSAVINTYSILLIILLALSVHVYGVDYEEIPYESFYGEYPDVYDDVISSKLKDKLIGL